MKENVSSAQPLLQYLMFIGNGGWKLLNESSIQKNLYELSYNKRGENG